VVPTEHPLCVGQRLQATEAGDPAGLTGRLLWVLAALFDDVGPGDAVGNEFGRAGLVQVGAVRGAICRERCHARGERLGPVGGGVTARSAW
jgi:hypothetical protein